MTEPWWHQSASWFGRCGDLSSSRSAQDSTWSYLASNYVQFTNSLNSRLKFNLSSKRTGPLSALASIIHLLFCVATAPTNFVIIIDFPKLGPLSFTIFENPLSFISESTWLAAVFTWYFYLFHTFVCKTCTFRLLISGVANHVFGCAGDHVSHWIEFCPQSSKVSICVPGQAYN